MTMRSPGDTDDSSLLEPEAAGGPGEFATAAITAPGRRALLIAGTAGLSLMCLTFIPLHLVFTRPVPWANIIVLSGGGVLFAAFALLQRRREDTRLCGTAASLTGIVIIGLFAFKLGIHAPALMVLTLLPLIGIFFVDSRLGLILAACGVLLVVATWVFDAPGHPLRGGLTHAQLTRVHALLIIVMIGVSTHLGWMFERTRDSAHRLMQQSIRGIAAARDKAQLADRAKTVFLATVSHEIRTPLNGVIGGLSLLEKTKLDADQRRNVEIATSSSQTLLQLVDAILDMSSYEAGAVGLHTGPTDLRALIDEVMAVNQTGATAHGISLRARIDEAVPGWLELDATRLKQVLNNLVSNGVKFTREGEVELAVRVGDILGRTVELRLEVRDTGIGMEEDAVRQVFEPFVQADASTTREFGGVGLGLAISKHLVEAMDGAIGAESTLGKGSLFVVRLPVKIARAPALRAPTPTPTSAGEIRLDGEVLVVEDNEVNAEVTARLLESIGVGSRVAGDGRDALRALAERDFDAVLMDCSMPRLDGFEATRRLRDKERAEGHERTPVIGLSAHTVDAIRADCLRAGMDDVRGKPVTVRDLREALCPYLDGCPCATDEGSEGGGSKGLPPILDDRVFEELREQLGDDMASFGNRLIAVFTDSAARDIAGIETTRRAEDLGQVAFHAHRLKGSACTVGASRLHCAARHTDEAARQGDLEKAGIAAGHLEEIFACTLRELAALPWRAGGGGIGEEQAEQAEQAEPTEQADQAEQAEQAEPTEQAEQAEQAEPTEQADQAGRAGASAPAGKREESTGTVAGESRGD